VLSRVLPAESAPSSCPVRAGQRIDVAHTDESKEHAMRQRGISEEDRYVQVKAISRISVRPCTRTTAGEAWAIPGRCRDTRTVVSRKTHVSSVCVMEGRIPSVCGVQMALPRAASASPRCARSSPVLRPTRTMMCGFPHHFPACEHTRISLRWT
jgi:hypothetical protein